MAYTDQQFAQLLEIIANSKLFSELSEQTVISDNSFFGSINTGSEDAKKIKLPLLRGYSGDWNASTNTPTLINGSGVSATVYRVGVAATRDLGSGAITYGIDEIIYYNGAKWVKLIQSQISDIAGLQVALDAPKSAENVSLDDTNLKVAPASELQVFSENIDSAVLKSRGTGVSITYVSSVAIGGTTFSQGEIVGEVHSDEGYFPVSYSGATGITVASLSSNSTYVYIDKDGNLQQQTSIPTRQDWSRKVFTMRIAINTTTNQIINFEYLNNPIGNYANSIRDLYKYLVAQGVPFKIGQLVTGRTDNLGFNIGSGSLMEFGGTGDIHNANIKSFDAVLNTSYTLLSRTATIGTFTDLVKFWDNNSSITALGSTTCVAHRVYRFSSSGVVIQYGQANYANINLARTGSRLEQYVLNPVLEDATFLGWWLFQETATVTSGTTKAEFIEYTIGIQGGTSSVLSGCLLKGNNLSDLLDVVEARDNLGVTALDDENVKKTGNQTIAGLKTFSEKITSTELKLSSGLSYSITDEGTNKGLTLNNSDKSEQLSFFMDSISGLLNVITTRDGYNFNKQIITSGKIRAISFELSALNTAPVSATATGATGEIRYTADYIYVCTATNTWKRVAISTW
jgi:hypothetical protein